MRSTPLSLGPSGHVGKRVNVQAYDLVIRRNILEVDMLRAGPSELSRILGISRQSIYRAELNNYIHREDDGKFDVEQTRRDWLDATPFSMGGIHDRISDDTGHAPQHRALSNLMDIWALSLKSMSLILREIQTFDEKDRHFQTLSLLFLC